jgi:hypothetical protein
VADLARRNLAGFFARHHARTAFEEQVDPEPERLSAEWYAWQKRHWERDYFRIQLREAEALSSYPEDPAPLADAGLGEILAWSARQERRRSARKA